jgi:ribosomal protein L37AE/L43A
MPKRTKEFIDKQDHPKAQGKLKRVAPGVWKDTKTGRRFAGGAYEADTGAEKKLRKAIREGTEELEEAQERLED